MSFYPKDVKVNDFRIIFVVFCVAGTWKMIDELKCHAQSDLLTQQVRTA